MQAGKNLPAIKNGKKKPAPEKKQLFFLGGQSLSSDPLAKNMYTIFRQKYVLNVSKKRCLTPMFTTLVNFFLLCAPNKVFVI